MKLLTKINFDSSTCRTEHNQYNSFLANNQTLKESKDILPFFKSRSNLSCLFSKYNTKLIECDTIAHEYPIGGDFRADLILGDSCKHSYLLVEFEDGDSSGIFTLKKLKSTSEWSKRLEGAFSQIIDWMWKLDDQRGTSDFVNTFGSKNAKFYGLIVIGHGVNLSASERDRLEWRQNRICVDSNNISIITFDQANDDFNHWLTTLYNV